MRPANSITSITSISAACAIATICAISAIPGSASAHIDPDPVEAPAGSEQSIGFTVQHGCDGSPTVQLDMRLPDGVAGITPEPPDGWDAAVDGNVVTFIGGPLPDDEELTVRVRMILPPTEGAEIYFPFVQRCEVGEIRWIDVPTDGSTSELDEPAPAMQLTAPLPTTTGPATTTATQAAPVTSTSPTTPSTTQAPDAEAAIDTIATSNPSQPSATALPTPSTVATSDAATSTAPSDTGAGPDTGDSSRGVWILLGSMLGMSAIGGLAYRQSKRAKP
jgi:uncharacterized protein YcnI